jgi:hypothetical protein
MFLINSSFSSLEVTNLIEIFTPILGHFSVVSSSFFNSALCLCTNLWDLLVLIFKICIYFKYLINDLPLLFYFGLTTVIVLPFLPFIFFSGKKLTEKLIQGVFTGVGIGIGKAAVDKYTGSTGSNSNSENTGGNSNSGDSSGEGNPENSDGNKNKDSGNASGDGKIENSETGNNDNSICDQCGGSKNS